MNDMVFIGWDVGGWHGQKNSLAVIDIKGQLVEGFPTTIDNIRDEEAFIEMINHFPKFVLGIDSPLRFPKAFKDLLNDSFKGSIDENCKMINNPLAYRYTDKKIHQVFKKHPLSASFDKLGNPATVAMYYINKFKEQLECSILPFDTKSENRNVIEVYPAILESDVFFKQKEILKSYNKMMAKVKTSDEREITSDERDAIKAAFIALAVYKNGFKTYADAGKDLSEGWIYYVAK